MPRRLARSVSLLNEEAGGFVHYRAGDEVPDEVAARITNPHAWGDDSYEPPAPTSSNGEPASPQAQGVSKITIRFSGGPWDGQEHAIDKVTSPVFAVGHEIGNWYYLDQNSPDVPVYFWQPDPDEGQATEDPDEETFEVDLEILTVPQLRELAIERSIDLAGATRKDDILEVIRNASNN